MNAPKFDNDRQDWYMTADDAQGTRFYFGVGAWPGSWEVSERKIGDGSVDGNCYSSLAYAFAAFDQTVAEYKNDSWGYVVNLSITWPDDPDDPDGSWLTVPVLSYDTAAGRLERVYPKSIPAPAMPELATFGGEPLTCDMCDDVAAVESVDFSSLLRDIADVRDWCGSYYDAYGKRGEFDAWDDPLFIAVKKLQRYMERRAARVFTA